MEATLEKSGSEGTLSRDILIQKDIIPLFLCYLDDIEFLRALSVCKSWLKNQTVQKRLVDIKTYGIEPSYHNTVKHYKCEYTHTTDLSEFNLDRPRFSNCYKYKNEFGFVRIFINNIQLICNDQKKYDMIKSLLDNLDITITSMIQTLRIIDIEHYYLIDTDEFTSTIQQYNFKENCFGVGDTKSIITYTRILETGRQERIIYFPKTCKFIINSTDDKSADMLIKCLLNILEEIKKPKINNP